VFTIIAGFIFLLVDYLLVPECMVHPEVSLAALAWLILLAFEKTLNKYAQSLKSNHDY
jgi:hypothetical protein